MVKIFIVLAGLLAPSVALPSQKDFESNIVGGEPAKYRELPYQVSLQKNGVHDCGGSVIVVDGVQIILTAAHCVTASSSGLTIVAGVVDLNDRTRNRQTRNVRRVIRHGSYSSKEYDIAILTIDRPLNFNANVRPIALPQPWQVTRGDVLVSGWGGLYHQGPSQRYLQKVKIPVVSDEQCRQAYAGREYISDSMLCAGVLGQGGKDACQGDSGGPVVSVSGNYLAGVVSWGYGCADGRFPGVQTEVSYFFNWIQQQVHRFKTG